MSHKLKLFIELNNEKQSLFVESDYNLITFEVVFNEIISQLNQNISLKTHSFEIFDMDFKEYVLILNENQMIENLSRIRITSKDTIDLNNELNISGFDEKFEEMSLTDSGLSDQRSSLLKSHKKDLSLSDNLWFTNYFFESKDNICAKNTKNSLKAKEETKTKPFINSRTSRRMQRLSKNNLLNYLDLPHIGFSPQQTYHTSIRKHKNNPLIVLRYNIDILKAIKLILNLMTNNKTLGNVSFEEQWKIISEQMVINGFSEWTPDKCRRKFFHIFKLYKKCLEKCPDLDIASIINPLFNDFHTFDNKHIFSSNEFKELLELRKRFQMKNQIKTIDSIDFRAVNDLGKLKKMSAISEEQIHMFKTLTECMDIIYKEVDSDSNITKNSIEFWDKVAKQLIFKDYIGFSGTECYNIFREYVSDYYAQVLVNSPDIRTATKIYPLFEFIDSLNLKQYLSYSSFQRIQLLRHKLTKTK